MRESKLITKKAAAPKESAIQRAALQLLAAHGYWAMRVNSGAIVIGKGADRRFFKGAPKGTSDILGALPPRGRLFVIEMKRPGKVRTPDQVAFQERILALGGVASTETSALGALRTVQGWAREEKCP